MREQIIGLLQQGQTYSQITARLGCCKSTVSYHAKKLGLSSGRRRYDWVSVQAFHDAGRSMAECCAHFGFCKDAWDKARRRGELVPRDHRIPSINS